MSTTKVEKKDFVGEMANETATAKTKEAEAISSDTERTQQSTEPSHWLTEMKNKMRHQYNKYLATTSSFVIPIILISVMITIVWVVPVIMKQNEKIAVIEAHLSHEIKATDGELQEDLTSVKENMTRLIVTLQTELEHSFERKILHLQAEIEENKEKLVQSERDRQSMALELDITQHKLKVATARIVSLEQEQNQTVKRVDKLETTHEELALDLVLTREESNYTQRMLNNRLNHLEESLKNTSDNVDTIEIEMGYIAMNIGTLNATKASVTVLRDGLSGKVNVSQFDILSLNLKTLTAAHFQLHSRVDHTSEVLNNTNTRLESVGDQLNDKVDMEDFEVHSMNLTSLAESHAQLHINLTQLTTDVDKLEGDIQQMDASLYEKATQEQVNSLSRKVQTLETSTVKTEQFQQLQNTVGNLDYYKANEYELRKVRDRVHNLESDRATKTNMNNLENKLDTHISSSDDTHGKLSDDVSSNSNDIQSNKNRLRQLETNSGSSRPTISWRLLGTTLSLVLVFIYSSTY